LCGQSLFSFIVACIHHAVVRPKVADAGNGLRSANVDREGVVLHRGRLGVELIIPHSKKTAGCGFVHRASVAGCYEHGNEPLAPLKD
jgi:hypothetical protein